MYLAAMKLLLFVFVLILPSFLCERGPRDQFGGTCSCDEQSVACVVALFSKHSNFSLPNSGIRYFKTNPFCINESVNAEVADNILAVVHRGGCAFDMKARVAASNGFSALLIINSEDELFPVGSSDPDFQASIPVLLIGQKSTRLVEREIKTTCSIMFGMSAVYLVILDYCFYVINLCFC